MMIMRISVLPILLMLWVVSSFYPASSFGAQVRIQGGVVRMLSTTASSPVSPQEGLPGAAIVPGDAAAAAALQAGAAELTLVDVLIATKIERTPQAILKAWSHRESDSKLDTSVTVRDAFAGTVVNRFESIMVLEVEDSKGLKAGNEVELSQDEAAVALAKVLSVEGKRIVVSLKTKGGGQANDESDSEKADNDAENESSDDGSKNSKQDDAEKSETGQAPVESAESDVNESVKDEDGATQANNESKIDLAAGDQVALKIIGNKESASEQEAKSNQQKAEAFARSVTLGKWDEVKSFLAELEPEDGEKVYAHVLTSLASSEPQLPDGIPEAMAQQLTAQMQQGGEVLPVSFLTPEDIIQISEACPTPIQVQINVSEPNVSGSIPIVTAANELVPTVPSSPNDSSSTEPSEPKDPSVHLDGLATLIRIAKENGHDFLAFVSRLEAGTTHFGSDDRIKRLTAADLLMRSGLTEHVESFLPPLDQEALQKDLPALRIWSKLAIFQYKSKRVALWLEKAWKINQWIVENEKAIESDKDLALTNLIELSPQVDKELGQKWMNASFTDEPQRGMMILTNLGTKSATMASQASMISESERLKLLRLQNDAAENVIQVDPNDSGNWGPALTLLAKNWIKEAETSIRYSKQNSRREYMQIDMYGNYYWVDQDQMMQMRGGRRQPRPIKLGDILEVAPSDAWREKVNPSLHTSMKRITANLFLRINEEENAFPYIEQLAETHPSQARDLVHEFLRIWTKNHDPNTDRRQRNPYIYFYGFDQKAEAIPLTRSKQERNLAELSGWIERIRKMPIKDVDEQLLANAFTTCHSSAEVFRIEAVKDVFGDLKDLKPETIAAICQKMRVNLSSNWRDVRTQEAKQTNRREPEVQQEVLRGYAVARTLAEEALSTSPESWQLHLAKACLMYDENAYSQTVQKSSEFSDRRDLAFEQFKVASDNYEKAVVTLEEKDQSTDVYDYWFYAALGACDLGKITDKTVPDLRQYAKIRTAIESLPGSLAEAHMSKVANNMFTRMSPIKPEIKFRYLRGGFEIVGEHPRAWEARNLYDYYKDLVSEIKFSAEVDGSVDVGHNEPFGVFVNLLHTNEIERESGGFGKYVQNQNSMQFAFNYGRPTEDYRDKFNDSVNQALGEHFEILSVTFQSADAMKSRSTEKEGWRVTPYAYVLLKPIGPEVDRIASLKLDMDFLDTSGYVVIPIESPPVVIDCLAEKGEPRPVKDLQVTQTLDERQADEGKLIVEISATGKGLIPDLEDLIDIKKENFDVVSIDDQGVLPTSFDPNSDEIQVNADRSWTVEYRAKDDRAKLNEFAFSDARSDEVAVKFQRYDDADLVAVDQVVKLERNYARFSWGFLFWLIPLTLLGAVGGVALFLSLSKPASEPAKRFDLPEDINPFTVLTLLKDIKHRNGISDQQATELQDSINRIEKFYFGDGNEEKPDDLDKLAKNWVSRAH